ncbi:hypothetical protein KC345_g4824 [Hortaea werneckii]|nr:hypothetical protein KC345_g4824 [Hortaea werneckii]
MVRPVKLDCHEAQPSHEAVLAMALLHARANKDEVDIFTPYHITNIKYPSVSLLAKTPDLAQSDLFMLPVENASERFEPQPLVNDPAIAAHAFRSSHEETAIFSMTRACIGLESEQEIIQQANNWAATRTLRTITHNALRELCGHMQVLSKQQGGTSLSVLTFNNRGQDCVLIKRHTSLFVGQGRFTGCPSILYIATVEGLRSTKCSCLFMQNLKDVVFRRTDRAVLHVQHMLHSHQHETTARIHDIAHPWKAKRRPNYESFEYKIAKPVPLESIADNEMSCNTCGNDLDTAAYRPLKMKCCGNYICRHCYINWADSKGPNEASCIYCRGRFFDDPTAESMTFGTVNGYYYPYLPPNRHFTPYENFERTCSDLDRNLAENNHTKITVEPDLMLRIWTHLLEGARLEDGTTSTPFHLQPARSPDIISAWEILRDDLHWLADDDDNREWSTASLFAELWLNQLRGFRDRIVLAGGRTMREGKGEMMYWVDARSPDVATNSRNVGQMLRPGTLDFVRRMLNRMLQFVHVRKCRTEGTGRLLGEPTGCEGFHGHGARMYVGAFEEGRAYGSWEEYFDPEAGELLCWREGIDGRPIDDSIDGWPIDDSDSIDGWPIDDPLDGSPMREEEEEEEETSEDDDFSDGDDEEGSSTLPDSPPRPSSCRRPSSPLFSNPRLTSHQRADLLRAAARANIQPSTQQEDLQQAAALANPQGPTQEDLQPAAAPASPPERRAGPIANRYGVSIPARTGPLPLANRTAGSYRGPPASHTSSSNPPRRVVAIVRRPQPPSGRLQDLVRRDLPTRRQNVQDRGQSP